MGKEYLKMLAQVVLPSQILDYFTVVGIEQTATEIHISLDEVVDREFCSSNALAESLNAKIKLFRANF